MWLAVDQFGPHEAAVISTLGRALVLAQNFEANCKFVLMTIELGKAFEAQRFTSLEGARPFVDELLQLMLGSAVPRFRQLGEISEANVATLVAAKDARNYVAHEGASALLAGSRGKKLAERIERLEREIVALAQGDSIVARWSYEIQEKEPAPALWAKQYSKAVTNCILEPIRQHDVGAG